MFCFLNLPAVYSKKCPSRDELVTNLYSSVDFSNNDTAPVSRPDGGCNPDLFVGFGCLNKKWRLSEMSKCSAQSRVLALVSFWITRSTALTLPLLLAGCSNLGRVTGQTESTAATTQSETAGTTSFVGGTSRIVVSFNDETPDANLITYDPTSRHTKLGATQMGWSYSDDGGANWTYGGSLPPPPGWAVLWGDPAMTTSGAAYSVVFMSNLAIPIAKFPREGIDGPVTIGNGKSAYIGGACIAKSRDGGKSFTPFQCVQNTDPVADVSDSTLGHFYDGGSMASSPSGEVYAAFVDLATAQIDVWRSPDGNKPFQRIATPFPNYIVASHPRLRIAPDGTLYAAAQILANAATGAYFVYLSRFINGHWEVAHGASNTTVVYPSVDFGASVQGSPLTVRTGPQFSFDVGAASEFGGDAVRLLYTRKDANTGRLFVQGAVCDAALKGCGDLAGWQLGKSGPNDTPTDAFNPDLVAWKGFIGLPPTWQGTYVYRIGRSATSVNVARSTIGYANGQAFTIPVDIIRNAPVCSDTRGYWGDYDDMLLTGFTKDGNTNWVRFLTDSSTGCTKRWSFTGQTQHVQASRYSY